jgi:hypothetical protein
MGMFNDFSQKNKEDSPHKAKKLRPKTSIKRGDMPRYLQPTHGAVQKNTDFDIKTFFYRDLIMIRYKENQRAQIINEK